MNAGGRTSVAISNWAGHRLEKWSLMAWTLAVSDRSEHQQLGQRPYLEREPAGFKAAMPAERRGRRSNR